jgi:hypothetical protein
MTASSILPGNAGGPGDSIIPMFAREQNEGMHKANTAFGIWTQVMFADDDLIPETRAETGLIITEILDAEPPKAGTR